MSYIFILGGLQSALEFLLHLLLASIACMDPLPDPGRHSAQFLIESQPTCADGARADNMYTLVVTCGH